MGDRLENPYRTDRVADALFVGRSRLIEELAAAVLGGRNAIRAVMGGRGMGKSSFARQLEKRLTPDALTIVASGAVAKVTSELGRALKVDFDDADDFVGALDDAIKGKRVAVVLDEVERVLNDPLGLAFLENLRDAYERADGGLAIVVLGGTEVRDLLQDKASPFLRIAGGIHTLDGLERHEAAELIRRPLALAASDDVVDALWAETAGHPWLLQMFMELAVQQATSRDDVVTRLPAAIRAAEGKLHAIAFPLWWSNLRDRGQDVYRRLTGQASPVPRAEWVARFGNDPRPWLEVLASTGVARLDQELGQEAVLARGMLFQRWATENHPATPPAPAPDDDRLGAWLTEVGVGPFERLVVRALARWTQATIEFPAAALKHDVAATSGDNALQPEAFFQMHAIVALLQQERELLAEPEALSMKSQGRADIKVRSRHDVTQRACVEFKIFGRKDTEVVKQVIGYATPATGSRRSFLSTATSAPYGPRSRPDASTARRPKRRTTHPPACFSRHFIPNMRARGSVRCASGICFCSSEMADCRAVASPLGG